MKINLLILICFTLAIAIWFLYRRMTALMPLTIEKQVFQPEDLTSWNAFLGKLGRSLRRFELFDWLVQNKTLVFDKLAEVNCIDVLADLAETQPGLQAIVMSALKQNKSGVFANLISKIRFHEALASLKGACYVVGFSENFPTWTFDRCRKEGSPASNCQPELGFRQIHRTQRPTAVAKLGHLS
jgi:hypothetical protein